MDKTIIEAAAKASVTGTLSFPDIVGLLLTAGVEYYHVDYVGRTQTYHSGTGDKHTLFLELADLPGTATDFAPAELIAAIRDSQQRGQGYRDFSVRAMQAGVQGYTAYLRGQRVIYAGRQGDQHIEWFPGAGPGK